MEVEVEVEVKVEFKVEVDVKVEVGVKVEEYKGSKVEKEDKSFTVNVRRFSA